MEVAGAATCRVWLSSLLRCGDNRSKQCLAESFSVGELGFGNHRKLLVNRLTICYGEKKKKRKLVKGLEKDLAMFAALGFGIDESGSRLARQVQGSMMTEAAEVLLRQLQCLREAEEEAKRKRRRRKQEKKAMIRMMEDFGIKASTDSGCEKSTDFNSSWKEAEYLSRSAVGGAGEAVGQVLLHSLDHDHTEVNHVQQQEEVAQLLIPASQNSTIRRNKSGGTKKVEICMGGKCKKFGASQLLDKFQSLAAEDMMNVVGCKCMGKCKEGPNVRLSVSTAAPAICSGVEIGDVDALMTSFLDIN